MQNASVDMIVRRWLLERGLPIHFYAEGLFHAASCLRDLTKDTLQVVNVANLPVGTYGEVDLPDDFVDDVVVSLDAQSVLVPLPKNESINPLRIHSTTTGQFVPYENQDITQQTNTYGFVGSYDFFWNVNDWGEPTGRFFGAKGGTFTGYKVIKERRQIQLLGTFGTTNIILQYISNGQSIDNATQIDWQAFSAIQSYIDWKNSKNAAFKDSPEARTFYNEKRLLKANLNSTTPTDIKNIYRNQYTRAAKS